MADVVVAGAAGRMGSRLVALLQEDKDLRLVAAIEAPGHAALGKDAGEVAGVGRLGVPITVDPDARCGRAASSSSSRSPKRASPICDRSRAMAGGR